MTTSFMPEIIQLESQNYLSESCSDDKSSVFLFNSTKYKDYHFSPRRNDPFPDNSHISVNKHERLITKNCKSAPVSITNTPDWQRRKPSKNEKSKFNLFPNQYGNKLLTTNSSENSFLSINCNQNKANLTYSSPKSNINNSIQKPDENKLKTCCLCWCCCCTFSWYGLHFIFSCSFISK